mmetsp:Transcript_34196/g.102081  ORF Transcript_34196/g.102081 Transcript_34196/m.102081 type:complete len:202 (+) Transcript_34196:470-1075(+)
MAAEGLRSLVVLDQLALLLLLLLLPLLPLLVSLFLLLLRLLLLLVRGAALPLRAPSGVSGPALGTACGAWGGLAPLAASARRGLAPLQPLERQLGGLDAQRQVPGEHAVSLQRPLHQRLVQPGGRALRPQQAAVRGRGDDEEPTEREQHGGPYRDGQLDLPPASRTSPPMGHLALPANSPAGDPALARPSAAGPSAPAALA